MLKYVLFDLDGTLVDTTNLILAGYRHTVFKYKGFVPRDEQLLPGFGTPTHVQMRLFSQDAAEIEEMLVEYRAFVAAKHDELIRPVPQVPAVLAELGRRGYTQAVVTSKVRKLALRGLACYGLDKYMAQVVAVEDVAVHKPDPAPIRKALELLAARPEEAIYVGDSVHDVAAARGAGVLAAGALWGPFPRETLVRSQPDYLLASMDELLAICSPLPLAKDGRQEIDG